MSHRDKKSSTTSEPVKTRESDDEVREAKDDETQEADDEVAEEPENKTEESKEAEKEPEQVADEAEPLTLADRWWVWAVGGLVFAAFIGLLHVLSTGGGGD